MYLYNIYEYFHTSCCLVCLDKHPVGIEDEDGGSGFGNSTGSSSASYAGSVYYTCPDRSSLGSGLYIQSLLGINSAFMLTLLEMSMAPPVYGSHDMHTAVSPGRLRVSGSWPTKSRSSLSSSPRVVPFLNLILLCLMRILGGERV